MPAVRPGKDATGWTAKSRDFLNKYRLYGAGITIEQFCRTHGFSIHTYRKWRKGVVGFKEEVNSIRKWMANHAHTLFAKEFEEEALVEGGLTPREAKFMAHFRETYDRVDSMKLVSWNLDELNEALATHDEFRRAVELVMSEIDMKIEDTLKITAANGSIGAIRKHLEAVHPERYTKRVKHEHEVAAAPTGEGIRESTRLWGEQFGAFGEDPKKALPEGVIDAEVIE